MRVFETRTATGSQLFSLLTSLHTTAFALPSVFYPLEMLGDTTVLARDMSSSGCRPRLKNVHATVSKRESSIRFERFHKTSH